MECSDPRFAMQKSVRELRRSVPSQDSFEDDSSFFHGPHAKTAASCQNGTPTLERVQRIQTTISRLLKQDLSSSTALSESLADFRALWQASRYTPNKAERTLVAAAFTEAGFLQLFEKVWQMNRDGLWCGGSLCLALPLNVPSAATAASANPCSGAAATNSSTPTAPEVMGGLLTCSKATDSSLLSVRDASSDPLGCVPKLSPASSDSEKVSCDPFSLPSKGISSSLHSPPELKKQSLGLRLGQKSLDSLTDKEKRVTQLGKTSKPVQPSSSSRQPACHAFGPESAGGQSPGTYAKGKQAKKSPEFVQSNLTRCRKDPLKHEETSSFQESAAHDTSTAQTTPVSSRDETVAVPKSTKIASPTTSTNQNQAEGEKTRVVMERACRQQGGQKSYESGSGDTSHTGVNPKSPVQGTDKSSPSGPHGKVMEEGGGDHSPQAESQAVRLSSPDTGLQQTLSDKKGNSLLVDLAVDADSVMQWKVLRNCLTILWNCSDVNAELGRHLSESELIPEFLQALRLLHPDSIKGPYGDRKLYFAKALLGILHNTLRLFPESRSCIRSAGGVEILQGILTFNPQTIKAKALIVLSYLVVEEEVNLIRTTVDMISFIVHLLRDSLQSDTHFSAKYGMCTSETLQALNNLTGNDGNKIQIVEASALPLYTQLLVSGSKLEQELSVLGLWSLAFASGNRHRLAEEPGCVEGLQNLSKSGNVAVCHAARGALWEIFHGGEISKSISVPGASDTPHVMVSYQWDAQSVMIKVKDKLKQAGFKVWMDVEHMTGSTLEAMALAVERAAVVLVCMSDQYKESPSCRTESEYTFRLRKPIVPLRVQSRYVPDGWLGMLVGSKLYFDFSREELVDKNMPRLIRELGDRGRISSLKALYCDGDSNPFTPYSSKVSSPLQEASAVPACNTWGTDDVGDWLVKIGLGDYADRFRSLDGTLLMEMRDMREKAPDFLFSTLRSDFNMSLCDILAFSRALSSLK